MYDDKKLENAKELTAKDNIQIMRNLVKDWHLGPIVAYDNNQGNNKFWRSLADIMYIDVKKARRLSCANCEYGKIDPKYLEAMEHVPYNKFDNDGGMRVWCDKFDFICHSLRVCKAWSSEEDDK